MYKCPGPVMAVPFYLFILIPEEILMNCPVPEGNQWRIVFFTTVNLFEVNWFATGNKMFLGQIFRNAQGKTTIQIQSCFEF